MATVKSDVDVSLKKTNDFFARTLHLCHFGFINLIKCQLKCLIGQMHEHWSDGIFLTVLVR